MYTVSVEVLTLESATARFAGQAPINDISAYVAERGPLAMKRRIHRPDAHDTPCATLFLGLMPMPLSELEQLAASELVVYVETSADLRKCTMYFAVVSAATRIRCNGWCLDGFPQNAPGNIFQVVLVSGATVLVATHALDESAADELSGCLQGSGMATGPNYNPWRMWSEEEMNAAEGLLDEPGPGVVSAEVVSLRDGWFGADSQLQKE